jgi:hypothetical protein
LVNKGHNCFAKVSTGIVHIQPNFFGNKIRRLKRRLHNEVKIKYEYGFSRIKVIKTLFYIITILPLIKDMIKGYSKKPDTAWFFHLPACLILVFIHLPYQLMFFIKRLSLIRK